MKNKDTIIIGSTAIVERSFSTSSYIDNGNCTMVNNSNRDKAFVIYNFSSLCYERKHCNDDFPKPWKKNPQILLIFGFSKDDLSPNFVRQWNFSRNQKKISEISQTSSFAYIFDALIN